MTLPLELPAGVPTATNPPHLFIVTPHAGFLCVLCRSWWQQIGDPYASCYAAPQFAKDAIAAGEAATGVPIGALWLMGRDG